MRYVPVFTKRKYLETLKKRNIDCFLYWVDLILFPIQYFILPRDTQQLTVKRILLRPFILMLPRR